LKYTNNISPEELERIERFITGAMAQQEASAFAGELSTDVVLQEKTEEVKLLLSGINEFSLEQKLESFHKEIKPPASKKNVRVIPLRRLLVAASVIVVVSLSLWWFFQSQNTNDKIYGRYYSPDSGLATMMSSSSRYNFDKAMVEYKNGEYDKAITAWQNLLKTKSNDDTLHYFIACASQAKKDYESAIENFQQVVKNPASAFYKDACWYLGLVYLKKGESVQAEEYIKRSDRPEAETVLKKIEKK